MSANRMGGPSSAWDDEDWETQADVGIPSLYMRLHFIPRERI